MRTREALCKRVCTNAKFLKRKYKEKMQCNMRKKIIKGTSSSSNFFFLKVSKNLCWKALFTKE